MATQVEVPHRKSICPDSPRENMSMRRPSQTERTYVQTFVLSKNLCVLRAFKRPHVQTFVRSKLHMTRFLCVPSQNVCAKFVRSSPDVCAFMCKYIASFIHTKCSQRFYNVFISAIDIFGLLL